MQGTPRTRKLREGGQAGSRDSRPSRKSSDSRPNARQAKKAINLTVDSALLDEAKAAGTNVSAVLEQALQAALSEHRWQKWREENREAIEASNKQLETDGMWYTPDWLR